MQRPQHWPRHMILARDKAPLPFPIAAEGDESIYSAFRNITEFAVAVDHYKPASSGETGMKRHGKVQSWNIENMKNIWWPEVSLSEKYFSYGQNFILTTELFPDLWVVHLERICMAKHRIYLTPGASPVHTASERARSKVHKAHHPEIVSRLGQEVIESAKTEWATQIVFAP